MAHAASSARRGLRIAVLGGLPTLLATAPDAAGQGLTVQSRNEWRLGSSTVDQHGVSFAVTGLSGLTWVGHERFLAVQDHSDKLVWLDVRFDCDGRIQSAALAGGVTLSELRDFEGIAWTDAARNSVWLSDETGPSVREYDLATGTFLQEMAIPAVFTDPGHLAPNFGFESLGRRADGAELTFANEEALTVDGPLSSPSNGSVVRLAHATSSGSNYVVDRQNAYETEPMHGGAISGGRSGLVELVTLPDGTVLALERSLAFAFTGVYKSSLFEVDFAGASDVGQGVLANGLIGQSYTPVGKNRLWSSKSIGQNLEGLCLGPQLPNGGFALLGICDDGDPLSFNTLVALELRGSFGGAARVDTIVLGGPASLLAGQSATLTLDSGPANAPFWIVSARQLGGSVVLGHPFDVGAPSTALVGGVTDAAGAASWSSPPAPAALAGTTLYVETAVQVGCLLADSAVLAVTIS